VAAALVAHHDIDVAFEAVQHHWAVLADIVRVCMRLLPQLRSQTMTAQLFKSYSYN